MNADVRCYRVPDLLAMLQMSKSAFYRARTLGQLPMLEELSPRIGRIRRYRADLVDAYFANRLPRKRSA